MILTCPACDTKYVVKDGAIPAGGRQVRCASCKHSWHEAGDRGDGGELGSDQGGDQGATSLDAAAATASDTASHAEEAQWHDADGAASPQVAGDHEAVATDHSSHHAEFGGPPMADVDQDAVAASEPTDEARLDQFVSDLPEPTPVLPPPTGGGVPNVDLRTTTLGSSSMGSFSLRTNISRGFSPILPGEPIDGDAPGDDSGADAARLDMMRSSARRTPISLSSDELAGAAEGDGQGDNVQPDPPMPDHPMPDHPVTEADDPTGPAMIADVAAPAGDELAEGEWVIPASHSLRGSMSTEFAEDEVEPKRRSPLVVVMVLAVLIAAAAAAFWFLAPTEWKARAGIAGGGATKLQVMITNSERQPLERGHELVAISGRVINPTDEVQVVPPIRAELRNSVTRALVYQWTIAPPARSIGPRSSATFNSAEVDIPQGGDKLTLALGA